MKFIKKMIPFLIFILIYIEIFFILFNEKDKIKKPTNWL